MLVTAASRISAGTRGTAGWPQMKSVDVPGVTDGEEDEPDGEEDGEVLGVSDGEEDGEVVWFTDGEEDGEVVGFTDGVEDGETDGDVLGVTDGENDGDGELDADEDAEADGEGELPRAGDPDPDGDGVGSVVADAVADGLRNTDADGSWSMDCPTLVGCADCDGPGRSGACDAEAEVVGVAPACG